MPTKEIEVLKSRENWDLMNAARGEMGLSYRDRIPVATQANIRDVVENLYKNRPLWNQFQEALINRIGTVEVHRMSWTNPLAEFKRGMMQFGDTIEEVQMGILRAHIYDHDREALEGDIFGTETVPAQSNFHRVNRENYYKVSVNSLELQRAFLQSQGVADFISQILEVPNTSNQIDEFLAMTNLFSQYEANGGFFKVQIPDVASMGSTGEQAKFALRKMRALGDKLPFVSEQYNAAHMPTWARKEDMAVFCTPDFKAALDVEALAAAFNIGNMDVANRFITIPDEYFKIAGCQAIMTTRDFFVVCDQVLETASIMNPANLQTNYFLHNWQIISCSRFVPAVMFTTEAGTEYRDGTVTITGVTGITFLGEDGVTTVTSVDRGTMVSAQGAGISTENGATEAVIWNVLGKTSDRTYITNTGVLHVAGDETASTLTVVATTVAIDPNNPRTDPKVATQTITVTGPVLDNWPVQAVAPLVEDITVAGVSVPLVAGTTTYTVTVPAADQPVTQDEVQVGVSDGVAAVTEVSGNTITITADGGTGAAVVYTITVQ